MMRGMVFTTLLHTAKEWLMQISYRTALLSSLLGLALVVAMQAYSGLTCYEQTWDVLLTNIGIFVMVPLIPAFIALFTRNPLSALGGFLAFLPWLIYAYYVDCMTPHTGSGGASLIYVVVFLYGAASCLIGVLFVAVLMWLMQAKVVKGR